MLLCGEERGERSERAGCREYGVGIVGRLRRVEGRVFDLEQRLHLPVSAPGMCNVGGVDWQGGSERGNRR